MYKNNSGIVEVSFEVAPNKLSVKKHMVFLKKNKSGTWLEPLIIDG